MNTSHNDSGQTDDALMIAYASGDERAFEQLYERHRGALYRYFLRQLNEDQAADCFQRTWMKLIQSRASYRAEGRFRALLFRMAHNELMDHFRRTKTWSSTQSSEDLTANEASAPEPSTTRQKLLQRLLALIEQLPQHQRDAWLMQQESGLSIEQIGDITSTSAESVKSRLRYAKQKLREGLARYV